MAIELTPTSITKDSQSIRGFEFNQALVAPAPIPQLIQVNFPSLNSNQVGKFRLSGRVNFDLLIKNFELDIKHDDGDTIDSAKYHSGNTPLLFFLVNPDTGETVRKITASITGYPVEPFYFVFQRGLDIYIKSSAGFHSLVFYCEPIYISNVIEPINLDTTT